MPAYWIGVQILWSITKGFWYRDVEKLEDTPLAGSLIHRLKTLPIMEALQVPLEPLELNRGLNHFGSALGLVTGSHGKPDPEYVLHVLQGAGHQELIRSQIGTQFKNFENYLRGKHATSSVTWTRILQAFGADEEAGETLRSLAHGCREGPLLPTYVGMGQALEGALLRIYRTATVGIFICQCCGGDIFDDARVWWPKQRLSLPLEARRFVDRLLEAIVGGTALAQAWSGLTSEKSIDAAMLKALADPKTHPIGNWMTLVRTARGLQADWELLPEPAHDVRLRKWRNGVDLLPLEKALSMTVGAPTPALLKHGMYAARALALAVDVVRATASTAERPSRADAQALVSERLQQFTQRLHKGVAEHFRRGLVAKSTPAAEN